jgi:hypothetical protein
MPLDYMIRVVRDPTTEPDRRDAMAKAAAPYIHPALAAVAHRLAKQAVYLDACVHYAEGRGINIEELRF